MKFPKKKRPKNVKVVEAGEEPENIDFTEASVADLAKAYNYYNQVFSQREAREFIERTYKKIDWEGVPSWRRINTYAWILKMLKRDCKFEPSLIKKMNAYFSDLERDFPKTKGESIKAPQEKKSSVWDKPHIANFDEVEDMIYRGHTAKEAFAAFKSIGVGLSKAAGQEIQSIAEARMKELESKEKDFKEAYSHLSAKEKKERIGFYKDCIEFLSYIHEAKKILRPRKPKVVTVEKKLKLLKFKKTDQEFGISSINPEKILGSKVLWVFNSKYRDLIKYESSEGFDIKGTTLQNVTSSSKKKIRKPEFLSTFTTSTKARMDKEFEGLKTKESPHPSRINEDTIILKVF